MTATDYVHGIHLDRFECHGVEQAIGLTVTENYSMEMKCAVCHKVVFFILTPDMLADRCKAAARDAMGAVTVREALRNWWRGEWQ